MIFGRRKAPAPGPGPTAADTLRPVLYGDVPMDDWPPSEEGPDVEPWVTFVRARAAFRAGFTDEAAARWLRIARDATVEARCALQAWTFLRAAGVRPALGEDTLLHGVVLEMAMHGGHDVLAAYRDGSARYLNYAGGVVVSDVPADDVVEVVRVAEPLARVIGTWDEPALPPLPRGHSRLLLLTPGGFRFGQGPTQALLDDAGPRAVVTAATPLLERLTSR